MSTRLIIGADEVGYGAIAGPLVAAAVAFESGTRQPVLKRFKFERGKDVPVGDSKGVDQRLLHRLSDLVQEKCVGHELCVMPPGTVDRLGAQEAKFTALRSAIQRLLERLALELPGLYENYRVIVDGDTDLGSCRFKYQAKANADSTVWQVGAASLLAKDAQVTAMLDLHGIYNKYGWNKNKGYPTKDHLAALHEHGVTKYHRRSYRPVKEALNAH
jgi:ribonuclease HII